MKIPIMETFPAIQGEGKEAGTLTYFIRVAGCNMEPKCSFCDTSYSWQEKGKIVSVEDLMQQMLLETPQMNGRRHFTFTGGEPTLYDDQILWLRERFPNPTRFSLETNGLRKTIVPYDNIAVSPKKQNLNIGCLTAYTKMPNTILKFVYEEVHRGRIGGLWWDNVVMQSRFDKRRVYIMPEGKSRKEQLDKMPEVIDYCIRNGYNFSPRLHCLAFDTRRGV